MIKVLYVLSTLQRKGPVIATAKIIKYMDRNIFLPIVLTLSPEPKDSMRPYFESLGVDIRSIDSGRLKGFLMGRCFLRQKLKDINPDIIQLQGFRPDWLFDKIEGYVKISRIACNPRFDYPPKFGRIIGALLAEVHIALIKKMHHPVTCSHTLLDSLSIFNSNMIAIRNGAEISYFSPAKNDDKYKLREELELAKQNKVLISVGQLIQRKDPLTILRAFKKAFPVDKKISLVFLGDGEQIRECKTEADGFPNIVFKGKVKNVQEYLRCADVFVSASHAEGLPNSVLEAMAAGLPVLLSDIPSHRELLGGRAEYGALYGVGDSDKLAIFLEEYILGDSQDKGQKSLDAVLRYFNAEKMSNKYQELYRNLASNV